MKVVYSVSENLDPASRCSVEVVNVEIYSVKRGNETSHHFSSRIFPVKKLHEWDFPIKMSGSSH